MKRQRRIQSVVLVLIGLGLCAFGLGFHAVTVHPQKDGAPATAVSESAAVREASVGGLERDESGKIRQTYTGESPKACAT